MWDLDLVRLTQISNFYNLTNHAQPTWSNQLVNGKNIWIVHKKPIDKVVEAEAWRYGVVRNFQAYIARPISSDWLVVILNLRIF